MPYLLYAWILWHAWRLVTREPAFHTLTDGVTIGRRLLASEVPDGISTVIDLTCEFPEPRAVRESRTYRSLPVLDAGRPALAALRELVEEIRCSDEGVYIHCANGHGRTGTVAGALLPTAGKVESGREAREFILGRRPGAHLNAGQQLFLEAFAEALRGDGRTAS